MYSSLSAPPAPALSLSDEINPGKKWGGVYMRHTEGKGCENMVKIPAIRQGMPEATRSWGRGLE